MDTFTARTPTDLLAIVPYVIGFHPEDSVVLMTFGDTSVRDPRQTASSSFHARADLPLVEHAQRAVVERLCDVAVLHRAPLVGLVLYTEDVAAARHFTDLVVAGMTASGIDVVDVIRADGDRFFAADDPDDPGTPYDLSTHAFTAAAVVEGRVVHESRTALQDSLIGTDEEDAAAVENAATQVVDDLMRAGRAGTPLAQVLAGEALWLRDMVRCCLDWDSQPSASDAGRFLVLVSFDALREVVWAEMTRATARRHLDLLRGLVRRAPADLRSGVASLLGFTAWLAGDGALAWCALDRCFEADPDDDLGQYVASLVESATPPSVWAPVPLDSLRIFQVADPLTSTYGPGRGPAGVQPS